MIRHADVTVELCEGKRRDENCVYGKLFEEFSIQGNGKMVYQEQGWWGWTAKGDENQKYQAQRDS